MKKILSVINLTLVVAMLTASMLSAQTASYVQNDLDGKKAPAENSESEKTNSITSVNDFTMFSGFPLESTYNIFTPKTGGIYCNMDADADLEIVYGSGEALYAININATPVTGWPKTYAQYHECAWSPAFGDIDGDGQGEVVAAIGGPLGGKIYAYEQDGSDVPGFPVNLGKYPLLPVLSDLDDNGSLEIIMGTRTGNVIVFNGDGTTYTGWPQAMDKYIAASVAVGDIDNNGVKDIVAESRNFLYAWDKDGNSLAGFPYPILDATTGSTSYSAPVLADIDNDGDLEISFCSHSDSVGAGGIIYLLDHTGTSLPGWPQTVPSWIYGAPVFADIDNDNSLELIIGEYGSSATPAFDIYAYNLDGSVLPNFPAGPYHGSANQITVADVDNDDQYELIFDENITVDGKGRLNAIEIDGTPVTNWPLIFDLNSSFNQPLLADFNNDGTLDIVSTSFNFDMSNKQTFIYLWDTGVPYNATKIVNPMYQFDATHAGLYVDNSVVPVELVSFEANQIDSDVQINWSTATETNNLGFKIYRNENEINFIAGKGTTTEKQNYTFVDQKVSSGEYTYRLEQIDFDGTTTIVGQKTMTVNPLPQIFALQQNYPNPFNPSTKITFSIPEQSNVKLEIVDVLGRTVAVVVDNVVEQGEYSNIWNAANISSGNYFAVLTAVSVKTGKAYNSVTKMVLMK